MRSFLVNSIASATSALEYFNYLHDGVITNIEIIGGEKICRKIPWEEQPEEGHWEFIALGWRKPSLKLVIHHNNYNRPNEPWDRAIHLIFPRCESIATDLFGLIDGVVLDLVTEELDGLLAFSVRLCERPVNDDSNLKHSLCVAGRARWSER